MTDKEMYFKAARMIATCPRYRLPYVMAMLRESGIEIDENNLPEVKLDSPKTRKNLAEKRAEQNHEKWLPTTNPYVLKLREAYDRGISLTHLGRKVGRQKASMYQYLYGTRDPSTAFWEKICEAIFEEYPDLDPRNQKEKPFWEE